MIEGEEIEVKEHGGKKHSKERESGVSEWESAGIWASAKQKSGEIAEARK